MRNKVTIVGAGHVGEVCSMHIAQKGLADTVLIDIIEDMPAGKGLDLKESSPIEGFDSHIMGTNDYEDTKDSDVVVITAGSPRKPGMSRDDLLKVNAKVITNVTHEVVKHSPEAIIMLVSNPVDVMSYLCWKETGFPKSRVMGMAGILDTARFRAFISMELGVSVTNIQSIVLGGHGDSMVPLPRYTTVAGIPITQLMDSDTMDRLIQRTRKGGGEIVGLLKNGSAYYAPASGAAEMVDSILNDRKKVLPCCALCEGEYGVNDIFFGVPVKLGENGVEEVIEIDLNDEQQNAVDNSARAVKEVVNKLEELHI